MDRYTKGVLTVIAASLMLLVIEKAVTPAQAQIAIPCGTANYPCYVASNQPVRVEIVR